MKRALLAAASLTLDAAVFAAAVLVIGAWFFGMLPVVLDPHWKPPPQWHYPNDMGGQP